MNDLDRYRQISAAVYEIILLTHQQQSDLLLEKYQMLSWGSAQVQAAFTAKLTVNLAKAANESELVTRVKRFLALLFVPQFFETEQFQNWEKQLFIPNIKSAESNVAVEVIDRSSPLESPAIVQSEATAILLLDGENIKLSVEEEKFLEKCCRHPIHIKVAFANWRNMGRYDIEFHQRGYQMIHVPAGKNNADFQMTAIGSSLFFQYPTAREVFVCSGDTDLTPLCNLLQNHGFTVYLVRRKDDYLIVTHRMTGHVRACVSGRGINPKVDIERKLASLLSDITAYEPGSYVNIATLDSKFKKLHNKSISELLKDLNLETKYVKFLRSCNTLKLQQGSKGWEVALVKA